MTHPSLQLPFPAQPLSPLFHLLRQLVLRQLVLRQLVLRQLLLLLQRWAELAGVQRGSIQAGQENLTRHPRPALQRWGGRQHDPSPLDVRKPHPPPYLGGKLLPVPYLVPCLPLSILSLLRSVFKLFKLGCLEDWQIHGHLFQSSTGLDVPKVFRGAAGGWLL